MTGNFKSSCKSLKLPFYISKKASAATDICQYSFVIPYYILAA